MGWRLWKVGSWDGRNFVGIGVVIWVLFLIFCFLMGIEEVRELSLKVCYVVVVYGRFFLMGVCVGWVVLVWGG